MDSTAEYFAIQHCGALKEIPRRVWVRNEVENPESVASHSMRTAYLAMILCPPNVNRAHAVQMALIHDLADSFGEYNSLFDETSAQERFQRENDAWKRVSESLGSSELQDLWTEMEANETPEAHFVNQVNKLEMLLQAEEYERQQLDMELDCCFRDFHAFFTFDSTREVYEAICERRQQMRD